MATISLRFSTLLLTRRSNYVLSPVFHHEAKTAARSFVYRLDRIAYKRTTEDFANDRIQSKNYLRLRRLWLYKAVHPFRIRSIQTRRPISALIAICSVKASIPKRFPPVPMVVMISAPRTEPMVPLRSAETVHPQSPVLRLYIACKCFRPSARPCAPAPSGRHPAINPLIP